MLKNKEVMIIRTTEACVQADCPGQLYDGLLVTGNNNVPFPPYREGCTCYAEKIGGYVDFKVTVGKVDNA